MTAKRILWMLLIIGISGAAFIQAGDTATFVDLGFSPDGKTYVFSQYGIQSGTLKPWAEIFVVDVPKNNFVSGGRLSYIHNSSASAGQDGSGAMYNLLAGNAALFNRYRVNFLLQGHPLYISLDEPDSTPGQTIEFRDFEAGVSYKATLMPTISGTGNNITSSFYINLERTNRNGSKRTYVVGTPSVRRSQIVSYRIRKVIIAPENGSMIMIIEMKKQNGNDYDIRYMVEAVQF